MRNARDDRIIMQRQMWTFKDSSMLIKINELPEKLRPSSRAVINSLFHLSIASLSELYSRECSGNSLPFTLILDTSSQGKALLRKGSSSLSLLPPFCFSPLRLHLSNSDTSICEMLFVKIRIIICTIVHILSLFRF